MRPLGFFRSFPVFDAGESLSLELSLCLLRRDSSVCDIGRLVSGICPPTLIGLEPGGIDEGLLGPVSVTCLPAAPDG